MRTDLTGLLPALIVGGALIVCLAACGSRGAADTVTVRVAADTTLHRMAGGLGASWHAIEDSIPFDGTRTHGGSAWGANPDPSDGAAWEKLCRHADWLGLDFIRVELEARMYEPERGVFTWDSREMQVLCRILDWCQSRGADVFLQQMWVNADWNVYPEFRGDPVKRVHSAPYSLEDFANGYAALVKYLTAERGYTCIKWLSISNEPGWDWSWWQMPPNESAPFTPGLAAVRAALDSAGISIPLSGPDWTDTPALEPEKIDFDQYIGAYDIHCYYSRFDWADTLPGRPDLPLSLVESRLAAWAGWAHERGKPFFLSELGSMYYGWGGTDAGPATWPAALKDAAMALRAMNVGVDGVNRWSFVNRGDLDGAWQMVETWDRENRRLLPEYTPFPNSYFVYGLLSRFVAKGSDVLASRVEGGADSSGTARVTAAALRARDNALTLAVLNDGIRDRQAAFQLDGLSEGAVLYIYRALPEGKDNPSLRIEPQDSVQVKAGSGTFKSLLPASSLTVFSTRRLSHDDPGITSAP